MSLSAPSSSTTNPFIEAGRSIQCKVRLSLHLGPHLLRSVRAFVATFPATDAGIASGSRWAQGSPILADCVDWDATRAAEPESEAVAALVKDIQVQLAAGVRPEVELVDLLTFIIATSPVASDPLSREFLARLDNDAGLHLDLDLTDLAAVEEFSAAAASLVCAFELGNGLNARQALNKLLSFVATKPAT
ncbi:MAG: hypothetical protein K2Y56_19545 [Methylobacterium sp.]|uniref:hypothetical protein n=1 Tax=Methylobacterium sp. TaxID=409 RepID=UPI0025DD63FD|nr:hypothetical protein [Methylobacterium sp.]MBX9933684.1 hypothetical protein [Methylobacterium sp.]